jgi:hypothetical protein
MDDGDMVLFVVRFDSFFVILGVLDEPALDKNLRGSAHPS